MLSKTSFCNTVKRKIFIMQTQRNIENLEALMARCAGQSQRKLPVLLLSTVNLHWISIHLFLFTWNMSLMLIKFKENKHLDSSYLFNMKPRLKKGKGCIQFNIQSCWWNIKFCTCKHNAVHIFWMRFIPMIHSVCLLVPVRWLEGDFTVGVLSYCVWRGED